MLYVLQGDICVTPAGQDVIEFKELKQVFPKERNLAAILTYIYYVFSKKDNPYWGYPPKERREQVVTRYNLFDGKDYRELEKQEEVQSFITFWNSIQLNDNDRNHEAFRVKAEHWRSKLQNMNNTPDEDEAYSKALSTCTKLAEDYRIKSMVEDDGEEAGSVALYLFEIPEDNKPHHLRLKL